MDTDRIEGTVVWQGNEAYEQTRRSMLWNEWTPDRFPEVIVAAASEQGVVEAVKLARAREMKVAVRGGGHSFCGSPLRDGGMLIDVSPLRELSIDAGSRTATVGPGVTGRELATALAEHGLGFPVGHCGSVPMSGYLLAGGFGWNMGSWGPACFSVRQVDVVTAEGELASADNERNADLFWAARGAGAGFFGVATRFQISVHPLPRVIRSSTYVYPAAAVDEVSSWAEETRASLPANVEMPLFVAAAPPGSPAQAGARAIVVTAAAFVDTEEEAAESLAQLETCPVLGRALWRQANEPTSIGGLQDVIAMRLPERHRYAADAFWSDQGLSTLLPGLAKQVVSAPSPKSIVIAVPVPPPPAGAKMPDAAFSMVGRTHLLCYAVWEDARDDGVNQRWLRDTAESLEPAATGHYVAEADLSADPSRSVGSFAPPNWERLQALRSKLDPGGVFHSFLGLEGDSAT